MAESVTLAHLLGRKEIPRDLVLPAGDVPGLIAAAQAGDTAARDRVIMAHLRFAAKLVHKLAPTAAPDVRQDLLVAAAYGHPPGDNGLVRAIEKFNPSRAGFAAYATHWVRAAVQSALRATAPTRTPWRVLKAKRTRAALEAQFGPMSDEEVAREAGVSVETVAATRTRHVTLDHLPAIDEEQTEQLAALQDREAVLEAARKTSPMAAEVVRMKFYEDATPAAIAARLGLTEREVSRLEKVGLAALRTHLERKGYGEAAE